LGLRKATDVVHVANTEAFERFRQDFLKRTRRITSPKQFFAVASEFDAAVVGSDQVWRPVLAKDTLAFFLKYVPEGVDRIAYAASFGSGAWEEADDIVLTEAVRRELRRFKAVSCRELSGVEICKETFGARAV